MSNNTETNNHDLDINTLKSIVNRLIQENKQLLESNKQLKIENKKLRDLIDIAAYELGTQIEHILGTTSFLLDKRHQEITDKSREDVERLLQLTFRCAFKLNRLTKDMKLDVSKIDARLKI